MARALLSARAQMIKLGLFALVALAASSVACTVALKDNASSSTSSALASLPDSALAVPVVRQLENYTCGAASSSAVFKYWQVDGYDGDYHSLMGPDLLHTTKDNGTDPENIVKTAQAFGLQAEFKAFWPTGHESTSTVRREGQAALSDLRDALSQGHPVILDIQAWSGEATPDWKRLQVDGHYVVAIGIDDANVYVMDPDAMQGDTATPQDPDAYTWLPITELLDRWHDYEDGANKTKIKFKFGRIILFSPTTAPLPLDPNGPQNAPLIRMG